MLGVKVVAVITAALYLCLVVLLVASTAEALLLAPQSFNKLLVQKNNVVFVRPSVSMASMETSQDNMKRSGGLIIEDGGCRNTRDGAPQSSRSDFVSRTGKFLIISATGSTSSFLTKLLVPPAAARGRATLEQAYDRYTPRILAGGRFYANDLRELISKNDWVGIKAATSDPPTQKDRSDRAKVDGGVAERAAKAGGFSDARVLVACDLFAGSFSDNSISVKTKTMQAKVEKLRTIVSDMNTIARQALGEEKGGGLLFGIGAKAAPSQVELQKSIRQLYVEGGNLWNEYIFAANDGLPVQLAKLSYL